MIGAVAERIEDFRFLRGEGEYVADRRLPDMVEAVVVRSPYASAAIKSIDATEARASQGVLTIVTAADLPADLPPIPCRVKPKSDLTRYLQPVLARDVVRFVGEPVAIIVANSRALAEDAAEKLVIDWEQLPAVATATAALREGSPKVHAAGNVGSEWFYDIGNAERAFAKAAVTVSHTFVTQRATGLPLETRGLLAKYDRSRQILEVFGPTKIPHTNRRLLSAMWRMSETDIRFVEPDVGGSFGVRGEIYPEDYLIPLIAMRLGRPVRWIEDRLEHFSAINHSRESAFEVSAAADTNGNILAFELGLVTDMGAYMRTHGDIVPSYASGGFCGPYRVKNYRARSKAVMTNKTPTGTIRSPGTFESNFARERIIDMIAEKLDLSGEEIRRRNLIRPEELPWKPGTSSGGHDTTFDAGDFPAVFERAAAEFGDRPTASGGSEPIVRGRGVAAMIEPSALGLFESARVEIDPSGRISVTTGCTSQGQGQETTLAQVAAAVFEVPYDQIRVRHGDTGLIAYGGGTNASRAAVMAGNAVHAAAESAKQKAIAVAAKALEVAEQDLALIKGRLEIRGAPGSGLSLGEAARLLQPGDSRLLSSPSDAQIKDNDGLTATSFVRGVPQGTSVFAVHMADVAVDRETGQIEVERYQVVCDVGRALNPMIVEGQIVGGVVQGLGSTLLEELVYDEEGQLQNASLADYLIPTVAEAPRVRAIVLELTKSPTNPLGVRGVGEVGPAAVGAAVANAVAQALGRDVRIDRLPLSPERILEAISTAQDRA